jgi:putative transcriptional regulator
MIIRLTYIRLTYNRIMIQILLNELLEQGGRTLYWLSQQSGVRYATIWNLSRGEVGRLSLDALDRICEALDCQPGDVLVRVKDEHPAQKTKRKARPRATQSVKGK